MEVKVEVNTELFEQAKQKLSPSQIATAMRIAINEGITKGRTMVRRSIQEAYNIKPSRINDSDRKKGLTLTRATDSNLTGKINAGHKPVALRDITGTKVAAQQTGQSISFKRNNKGSAKVMRGKKQFGSAGISVEVIRGQRRVINSAFVPGARVKGMAGASIGGALVFARGKQGKPAFEFAKPRLPIGAINSVSVASAATNLRSLEKYEGPVNEYAQQRFEYHIGRLIKQVDGMA